MTHFVSIIKYPEGMAAYHISGSASGCYTAQLVKSTAPGILPRQLVIEKDQVHQWQPAGDGVRQKLVGIIKKMEDDGEELSL